MTNAGKALPGSALLIMEKFRQRDGIVVSFRAGAVNQRDSMLVDQRKKLFDRFIQHR